MKAPTLSYESLYKESVKDPERFWAAQAQRISWYRAPQIALSKDERGLYRWYPDGKLNICYLALDKHIEEGYGEETALIYDAPVTETIKKYSFNQVKDQVEKLAGGLKALGVKKGDRVIIYMPMIPQAAFSMLACARIGAVHTVVFGGFAPDELAARIDDAKAKIIITASASIQYAELIAYKPMVDEAISKAVHKPEKVILYNRKLGAFKPQKDHDVDYEALISMAQPADCIEVEATHPLYLLYTSGTTGKPKGVLRDHGGYAVALSFSMEYVYDMQPGDTFWAASDIGWILGHSYGVYGPLIHRCGTVLFEGKPVRTPDAGTFWRVISQHRVKTMFTAPTAIRAIKNEDPEGLLLKKYDLSSLKYQVLGGERCDAPTIRWLEKIPNVRVMDQWWQTETGWAMLAHMVGLGSDPIKIGSVGKPVCGYHLQALKEDGSLARPNEEGYIVAKLPLPPGALFNLWGATEDFKETYLEKFPGYYLTGDAGYFDQNGYGYITGRIDDVINVSGHRLSTIRLEEVVISHPAVNECAVVGLKDEIKGQVPIAVVALKAGQENYQSFQLQTEIVQEVRNHVGPIAAMKQIAIVSRLPRTRSGKVLRRLIQKILDGEPYSLPATIEDPQVIDELIEAFKAQRLGVFAHESDTIMNSLKILAKNYYHIDSLFKYMDVYRISTSDPEGFWAQIAQNFSWKKPWSKVLEWDFETPSVIWFKDAKLNITENIFERQWDQCKDQTAIIWEPNDPKEPEVKYTYAELFSKVCQFANALKQSGVGKGDRVAIYMPMIPELAISILACARIGAIHSVVFGGFSSASLADRIQDAQAKILLTADGAFRGSKIVPLKQIADEALIKCSSVKKVIVAQRTGEAVEMKAGRDYWWSEQLQGVSDACPAEEMDAEDPLFILYTSGSTGKPKGLVHTIAGYMIYNAFVLKNTFQYQEGDVYFCTADIGWITGHSCMVYGPLLNGVTSVMFEGIPTYPDAGRFWDIVQKYRINQFYTAPTAIRALMTFGIEPLEGKDLSSLKVLGTVGEPINSEAWHWYHHHIGGERCPVIDTWWQTETGGIMLSPLAGITPTKPTYATLPLPGVQPTVVDQEGKEIRGNGIEGNLCIRFPWPGMARTIWGDHQRFKEMYFTTFKGYYFSGDGVKRDEEGYYRILGRVDDVINVSGHRLGTAEIENAINQHPRVSESAVVGFPHKIKGQGIFAFVICHGTDFDREGVKRSILEGVLHAIGPIARPDRIVIVNDLPKTRSGKIMRRILRKIAQGDYANFGDISTLLNPDVVERIIETVRSTASVAN